MSVPFRVFASTAVRLQVTLPGETQKPGKCDYLPGVVCRLLAPAEGLPGTPLSDRRPSNIAGF